MKNVDSVCQFALVMAGSTKKTTNGGVVSTPSHTYNDVDDLLVGDTVTERRNNIVWFLFSCFMFGRLLLVYLGFFGSC